MTYTELKTSLITHGCVYDQSFNKQVMGINFDTHTFFIGTHYLAVYAHQESIQFVEIGSKYAVVGTGRGFEWLEEFENTLVDKLITFVKRLEMDERKADINGDFV